MHADIKLDTPRTELEVAAAVLCRLFTEHVLNPNATTVAEVARVTGVSVDAIRWAWRQADVRPYRPPATSKTISPEEGRRVQATDASRKTKAYKAANPSEGHKVCARCGDLFPVEQFPWKNRKKNTRRSYCELCWKAKCRERYLSVTKSKLINEARLTFVLGDGDEVVGLACMDCGLPLRSGDHVYGKAALHHVECDEAKAVR